MNHLLLNYCTLCRAKIRRSIALCGPCLKALPYLKNACPLCAIPTHRLDSLCGQCARSAPAFDRTLSVCLYQPPVDVLVGQLKYHERVHVAKLFARIMGDRWGERCKHIDALLPVPLHPYRQRQRGFNQATQIAKWLGRYLSIPVDHRLIHRIKNTPAQAGMSHQARRQNLSRAFQVTAPCQYQSVALVDDVMTSGQTVQTISKLLKRAGCKEVTVLTFARTPWKSQRL